MAGINAVRVLIGGFVAGLIGNAFDFVINTYLLTAEWEAVAVARNLDPVAAASPTPWIVIDFLVGILGVWTYAAMRPRFGAGPRTAVCAALAIWGGITLILTGLTFVGFWPMALHIKMSAYQAVSILVAVNVGGMLYKE